MKKLLAICSWYRGGYRGYLVNEKTGNARRVFVASDLATVPLAYQAYTIRAIQIMNGDNDEFNLQVGCTPYNQPMQLQTMRRDNLATGVAYLEYEE